MIRLLTVVFIVAIASPVLAVQKPDSLAITVREACGTGMHRVNGICVRTAARRQAARCAPGLRWVNGRCIK